VSRFQALFEAERQAFAAARRAYIIYRWTEALADYHGPDNRRFMRVHSLRSRAYAAAERTEAKHEHVKERLDEAWDYYSRFLTPFSIVTEADAAVYDLSDAGAAAVVDNLIDRGIVEDPYGWRGRGWIEPRKFVAWFLRKAQAAVIVGHNE
jgi:hypothetical protein